MGDGAGGSVSVGNGNSPSVVVAGGGSHQPSAVFANGGGGGLVEKVKFTVSVRGRQWSSARHVSETLEEFAAAIQRNARRLGYVEEDDTIYCLQLAYSDGSEPEDLDVDATLGDVIICMGDKQLVAVVNSNKPAAAAAAATPCSNGASNGQASPIGNAIAAGNNSNSNSNFRNGVAHSAPVPPSDFIAIDNKFSFPPYKPPACRSTLPKSNPSSTTTDPARALKINIPAADSPSLPSFQDGDRGCSFHPDYVAGASLPPRPNGKVTMTGSKAHGGGSSVQQQFCSSNNNNVPTPSPAELANMLVRSSSHPHRMQQSSGTFSAAPTGNNRSPAAVPTGGFQSFANALLSRLPMLPNQNIQCPHGATTNIALLAQFLASQLRAFVPPESTTTTPGAHPADKVPTSASPATTKAPKNAKLSNNGQAAAPAEKETHHHHHHHHHSAFENDSPKHPEAANVKLSVSGSHEKDESSHSSSANVNAAVAPSSGDGVDSEHPNGRTELVFLVNRRSKTRPQGVGTHHLKMSDLSTYFHLSVVDAAKKLGVSQTTLKKACRKFGLKRWPGRKVRSLESTIHGLEHTIAVGQGAGLEELTEAYMRSEVSKLQQEMDQLVHGTPAQVTHTMHSPAVRTADLYKRLYSRGWRSKYHSPGRHDMINLNTGNHTNRTSGLTPPTVRKNSRAAKENGGKGTPKLKDEPAPKQQQQQQQKEGSWPGSRPNSRTSSRLGTRDTVMKDRVDIEGLLQPTEPASKEPVQIINDVAAKVPANELVVEILENGVVNNNCAAKTVSGEEIDVVVVEEKEVATFAERSPKRPKRECRIAAEGAAAVRQGLRSSTCAM